MLDVLNGKKTYLVVVALMVLNVLSPESGLNLETLKETLLLSLGATARSALTKLEK